MTGPQCVNDRPSASSQGCSSSQKASILGDMSDESPEEGALKFSEDGNSLLVYQDGEWTPDYTQEGDSSGCEFEFKDGDKKT